MNYVIDFDICAIALIIIMVFSVFYREITSGVSNKFFLALMIITALTAFTDVLAVIAAPNYNGVYLACTLYYVTRISIAPCFLLYLVALTDGWKAVRQKKNAIPASMLYLLMVIAIVVVNPLTGSIFTIDEFGICHRGPQIILIYIGSILCFVMAVAHIVKYRRFYPMEKVYCLLCIVPATLVAVVIQAYYPHLLIESFAQALCLIFYSITLQSPDDKFSEGIKAFNRQTFIEDMQLAEFNKKQLMVYLFKIRNYAARVELVSYEASRKLTTIITDKVMQQISNENICASLYHFGMGAFGIIVDEKDVYRAEEFAERIGLMLSDDRIRKGVVNSRLEYYECLIRCPQDIDSFNSIQPMLEGYQDFLTEVNQIQRIWEVDNYENFTLYSKLDTIINRAIDQGLFEIYYMPIYSTEEERYISAEALLRLKDPEYGFINPELLITHAEETGDIHKIGRTIVEEVCKFVATPEFTETGLDFVEINLSVEQFRDRRLCEKLIRIVGMHNVDPSLINFEITETAVLETWQEVVNQTNILSAAGFSFSLDDYGQSNSNLKRLSSLPLEIVKLDKSLTEGYDTPKGRIILKNSIKMLKALGVKIAAEGIENARMATIFQDFGCDYLQGYDFSKALPLADFLELMREVQPK